MFKDDNTVIHLKRPQSKLLIWHTNFLIFSVFLAQFSVRENLLVVAGTPETKELKDMMPDILKQVGPKQYQFLKSQMGAIDTKPEADDDDDVPELVGTFEDAGKKKKWVTLAENTTQQDSMKVELDSKHWNEQRYANLRGKLAETWLLQSLHPSLLNHVLLYSY